ncbi:unnamed protein product, partial [Rotaria magnacalcarata]
MVGGDKFVVVGISAFNDFVDNLRVGVRVEFVDGVPPRFVIEIRSESDAVIGGGFIGGVCPKSTAATFSEFSRGISSIFIADEADT